MPTVLKKICLLGEFAVGKTSLVRRFMTDTFEDKYLSAIGTQISRKQLTVQKDAQPVTITLIVWDIAGSEKFDQTMRSYYQGAKGGILICDLTRPNTIEAMASYAHNFWQVNPNAPLVVVGNKVDLISKHTANDESLAAAATEIESPWFISSAKTGENVNTAFQSLAERILIVQKS